jgi:hypothetical protein
MDIVRSATSVVWTVSVKQCDRHHDKQQSISLNAEGGVADRRPMQAPASATSLIAPTSPSAAMKSKRAKESAGFAHSFAVNHFARERIRKLS